MTLFTTLQSLVPQQKISEIAGRIAQSRHPMVKNLYSYLCFGVWHQAREYARVVVFQYDSFNDFLPVSSKMRAQD